MSKQLCEQNRQIKTRFMWPVVAEIQMENHSVCQHSKTVERLLHLHYTCFYQLDLVSDLPPQTLSVLHFST